MIRFISFCDDIAYVRRGISCNAKVKRFINKRRHCPPRWVCSIVKSRTRSLLWVENGLIRMGKFFMCSLVVGFYSRQWNKSVFPSTYGHDFSPEWTYFNFLAGQNFSAKPTCPPLTSQLSINYYSSYSQDCWTYTILIY